MKSDEHKLQMMEEAIQLGLATRSRSGALVVETGKHTGRSANARYICRDASTDSTINWGKVNQPVTRDFTDQFFQSVQGELEKRKTYQTKRYVASFPVSVTSDSPWHIAFADNMFRSSPVDSLSKTTQSFSRSIEIFHLPYTKASSLNLSSDAETLIILDPAQTRIGIVGTAYAGEIKKSAFTLCNYIFPEHGILPMHASANTTDAGENSSVIFGLSGTGKTTLSACSERAIIGDDEIVWTSNGISNLEGGCYAKLINLDPEKEPEIYRASNQEGAILENVVLDGEGNVDYNDGSKTENTRGSYSITALDTVFDQTREATPPKSIVFLAADAFGALPAVARLDRWQAQYHFISGYTAKVAGTEIGVVEPQAVFSACFGGPFMPRQADVYSSLLSRLAEEQGASIWLLNTGWIEGGYKSGKRFPLPETRKILRAIQSGEMAKQPTVTHPVFGFEVPTSCDGIDSKWFEIPEGPQVEHLADLFRANMDKVGSSIDSEIITRGGPVANRSAQSSENASPRSI